LNKKKNKANRKPAVKRVTPPVAAAVQHKVMEVEGRTIYDEYFWMRDRNNPKVLKYLEAENAYGKDRHISTNLSKAESQLKQSADLQNQLYEEIVSRVSADQTSAIQEIGDYYYYTRMSGDQQYPIHCRKFESMDSEEQIFLNENNEAEGVDYFALGVCEVSPDSGLLMYGVDSDGSENFSLRFKDLTSNTYLDDEIYPVGWTARWAADSKTIFYSSVISNFTTTYFL
jgi:oligopeptidase B